MDTNNKNIDRTKAFIEKEALEKENIRLDNEILISKIDMLKLLLEAYVYDKDASGFSEQQRCIPIIEDNFQRNIIINKIFELVRKL
jgi:hypothetical protein